MSGCTDEMECIHAGLMDAVVPLGFKWQPINIRPYRSSVYYEQLGERWKIANVWFHDGYVKMDRYGEYNATIAYELADPMVIDMVRGRLRSICWRWWIAYLVPAKWWEDLDREWIAGLLTSLVWTTLLGIVTIVGLCGYLIWIWLTLLI